MVSISLGSTAVMRFRKKGDPPLVFDRLLERRSAAVLSGQARFIFTHEIPSRKSDKVDGVKVERERRVSLTFRTLRSLKHDDSV